MQAGDEQAGEEGSLVLDEVAVRPLCAVEAVGLRVLDGLLLARVGDRVLEAARLAGLGAEKEVQNVDEKGARGGDEDVAVVGGLATGPGWLHRVHR